MTLIPSPRGARLSARQRLQRLTRSRWPCGPAQEGVKRNGTRSSTVGAGRLVGRCLWELGRRKYPPSAFIERFNGSAIFEKGTLVSDGCDSIGVGVVAAWNALNDPDLAEVATFTPAPSSLLQPAEAVPAEIKRHAGVRR